jgi:hypothetical protein
VEHALRSPHLVKILACALALGALASFVACSSSSSDPQPVTEVTFSDYYEGCDFDEDCPVDNFCYEVAVDYGAEIVVGRMCSNECFDDFDCVEPGFCAVPDSGPPLCYQRCVDDFDCFPGFICVAEYGFFTVATCQPG